MTTLYVQLAPGRVIGLDVYNTVSPTRNLCVRNAGPGIAIGLAAGTVDTRIVFSIGFGGWTGFIA